MKATLEYMKPCHDDDGGGGKQEKMKPCNEDDYMKCYHPNNMKIITNKLAV